MAASYSLIGAAQAFCAAFHPDAYCFAPADSTSPLANRASNARLNTAVFGDEIGAGAVQ
jgi:hypothetical protein